MTWFRRQECGLETMEEICGLGLEELALGLDLG